MHRELRRLNPQQRNYDALTSAVRRTGSKAGGSPRSSTILMSTFCDGRTLHSREVRQRAWMVSHGRTMERTSRPSSRISMAEFIGERIGHNRRGEAILPRRTAGNARSASLRWKTKLSNALA